MAQAESAGKPVLRLREERLRRGWSITRVTMLTGIASADLSVVERGLRPAHPGWRRRIADAFGLSEGALFRPADSAEPGQRT